MQLRILILAATGCRVSEVVALQLKDFDLVNRTVIIFKAYTKPRLRRRGSSRILPLSPKIAESLAKIFADLQLRPDDFVLSGRYKHISPDTVRKSLKLIARAAGLDPRTIFPHVFRLNLGIRLNNRFGAACAAEVLGHREEGGIRAMEHYRRRTSGLQREEVEEVVDSFLKGPLT